MTAQWPGAMTQAIGRQVQRCRTDPSRATRMTAEQVANAVTELGLPYTRAQVTNLEAGRRTSVTLGELIALAAMLGVPPMALAFPAEAEAVTEILPGQMRSTENAARWFAANLMEQEGRALTVGRAVLALVEQS